MLAVAVLGPWVATRPVPESPGFDREQLRGFAYVGSAGLVLLCVAVGVIAALRPGTGRAESVVVLGLFGYLVYAAAALVVLTLGARRSR